MTEPPLSLAYAGLGMAVDAPEPADRAWLAGFLAPWFETPSAESSLVELSFAVDPAAFAEIEKRGPAQPGEPLDGFVLDNSTLRFPRWAAAKSGGNTIVAFDAPRRVFYEVGPDFRVRITAESRARSRVALMRVVREFAMHACLRRGDVFLHAGCFSVEGQAVVIAGAKAAGKTTTLTGCLQLLEKAGFIANDRVHLRAGRGGYEARGMPTVLTFRPGGLELLPGFARALRSLRGSHHLSGAERAAAGQLPRIAPWSDGRTGLDPARYAALLGREPVACAKVGAIVFPEVVAGGAGLRATRLDPAAAAARLEQALFGVADLRRRSQLFDLPGAGPYPGEDELRARARRVVESVPSYVWHVGRGAPADRAGLGAFLESLGIDAGGSFSPSMRDVL